MPRSKGVLGNLGLTILVMVIFSAFTICGYAAEKTFKFGNAAPFSGPYAPWGWMIQYSFEIAAEDINKAGGIRVGDEQYNVEIVKYDNLMDPTVSATITRQAIYNDRIKYMSVISTDEAAAINELVNDSKVVMFALSPFRDYIGPKWPFSFQTYYEIVEGEDVILRYVRQKYADYKKVAALAPDDVRGHIAGKDFEELASKLGFEVVDVAYTDAAVTDYYSTLTPLLAKGVDIINVSATGGAGQGNIIKQARELGFKGLFMHPDTIDVPTVAEVAGIEALEGNLAASQLVEMPTEIGKSWAERYTARYGSLQYWASYSGYDTLMLIKLAIEKANTFDTEQVLQALGTVTFDGTSGTVSFEANKFSGGLARVLRVPMHVVQIQNGKEVDVHSDYSTVIFEK